MALILNEEQQSLKDIAKEFLQKNAPVTHFREIRDTNNELGYDEVLWKEMVNLGWSGILIPEEYGGFDFGMVGMGSIFEEMGKTLTPSPLFATGVLGASLISLGGNDSQKLDGTHLQSRPPDLPPLPLREEGSRGGEGTKCAYAKKNVKF